MSAVGRPGAAMLQERERRETLRLLQIAEMHKSGAADIAIALSLDLTMAEVDAALSVRWVDLRAKARKHNIPTSLFR